jgi:hypothetical protein
MKSAGLVLAAGGIAIANEAVFAPLASGGVNTAIAGLKNFNWRIIPATGILALTLGGLEKLSPPFAVGVAGLILVAVLIVPIGNAPTPIDNITKTLGI